MSIAADAPLSPPSIPAGPADSIGVPSATPPAPSLGAADAVETALAAALAKATAAGEWTIVAQLARELEARRSARANVVDLRAARARRTR